MKKGFFFSIVFLSVFTLYSQNTVQPPNSGTALSAEKTDTLPRLKLSGAENYSDQTVRGIYMSSYGFDVFVKFADFPHYIDRGDYSKDATEYLERVEAWKAKNPLFIELTQPGMLTK